MKFTDFKNISSVCKKFSLEYKKDTIIGEKKLVISNDLKKFILDNFNSAGTSNNEYAICEALIYPIISITARENSLPIWSHCAFESKELDISGFPDYLFALAEPGDFEYKKPIVCLGEAKKDDFVQGWAQVSAEMVVAQKINGSDTIPIYGLVTNGKVWEFGVLNKNCFTMNSENFIIPKELDKIMNVLNWLFSEAYKNAKLLEEK